MFKFSIVYMKVKSPIKEVDWEPSKYIDLNIYNLANTKWALIVLGTTKSTKDSVTLSQIIFSSVMNKPNQFPLLSWLPSR